MKVYKDSSARDPSDLLSDPSLGTVVFSRFTFEKHVHTIKKT